MVDIATPQVEPTNNDRLQRVGINDLKREIALTRSPLVVTSGGKPLGIIYPYDPKMDKQVQTQVTKYKAGDVTYAKYKEEMLAAAMEALMERQVLVKPSDIIASENLEEVKKKNKIDGQRPNVSFNIYIIHRYRGLNNNVRVRSLPFSGSK